jgi:hypothetical protein
MFCPALQTPSPCAASALVRSKFFFGAQVLPCIVGVLQNHCVKFLSGEWVLPVIGTSVPVVLDCESFSSESQDVNDKFWEEQQKVSNEKSQWIVCCEVHGTYIIDQEI